MGLKIYEEDLQSDEKLKSFDNDQKVRMKALIYTGKGERPFDCVKEVLTYMDVSNKKIEDEISECKGRIQRARKEKNQKISAKNEEYFDELVEEFSDISEQMMELCTDVLKYANSARKTHSCIEKVIKSTRELKVKDYKNIFNELQKLKKKDTTFLIEKIDSLRMSNENMLKRLKRNSNKLHKELQSCGAFKTVTNMMFMAATAGVVICAILAVALASNPLVQTVVGIVSAACEITAAGKHWIVEYTKKWDDNVKARQAQSKAMQDATRDSIDHLNAIEDCIGRVLTEIDTLLLLDGNSKNEGGEGSASRELDKNHQINEKMKKFLSAINDLEKKTEDCQNHIMKTRKKVKKHNRNVKTT